MPNENPGEVRIKIIDSGTLGKVFKCRIKRTQKLRKMMETYANTNNLEMAYLRFFFDEKRVHKVRICAVCTHKNSQNFKGIVLASLCLV